MKRTKTSLSLIDLSLRPLFQNEGLRSAYLISTIFIGLVIDQHIPVFGQVFVNVWVCANFIALVWFADSQERIESVLCVILAVLGEMFLSFVWGVYEYRELNLPIYVPPGHVHVFLVGKYLAKRFQNRMNEVSYGFGLFAFTWIIAFKDEFSMFLAIALVLPVFLAGEKRSLYLWMCLWTFLMENLAVMNGNWAWATWVPIFELDATKVPVLCGAFYIALDWLIESISRPLGQRQRSGLLAEGQ